MVGSGGALAASGQDTVAVVLEVSEPVGAALDEFHFTVEAFRDAVLFSEALHAVDLLLSLLQSGCEVQHGGDLRAFEICNEYRKQAMSRLHLRLVWCLKENRR